MDTTTTDGGATEVAEPVTSAAVTTADDTGAQVISNDENGTPTIEPVTSEAQSAEDAVSTEPEGKEETQATQTADDIESWAEKKGLDLKKADPVKLATMYRDAERKMHEATAKARELESASVAQVPLDYTGNPDVDALTQQVNTLLVKNQVNDYFSNNPDAREFESKMAEIVTKRPHLKNDLDALYALARTDPSRDADLKKAGGKEALTNLAQKQQQIPPTAGATNSNSYESATITPQNVFDMVDSHDQAWFEKNHDSISKAMSGK